MKNTPNETQTWPDLAIGLYDKLTGRGTEISYAMKDLQVSVPSRTGEGAEHAKWTINGVLSITTREPSAS